MRDLDNGLRVIIVQTDYPDIVTLQIPVQVGSRNEVEPGKSGFAHFFEHMMFRGTDKYPPPAYTEIMKKAGADQNASTHNDYTNYRITFTKEDLEKILEVEADRFRNLSYSEDFFRTEAPAVKGEYLKNYANLLQKAYQRLRELGFTTHTYRHTTMGFIDDIDAMPEQFEYSKLFFHRWYRPEKTSIIVVGDVDPEATLELVKKYWGEWERGEYDVDIPVEPPYDGPVYEHIRWDGPTLPYLLIAYRGPGFVPTDKDMPAINLLSSIYFSDSSDLYRKLVLEDQAVDFIATDFENNIDPNLLMIYARLTDSKYAADVEAAIRDTLVRARTELVDAAKVEETKSRLRYSFTSSLGSSGSIGAMLARYVHFRRTPETVNEMYRSIDALTPEDLRDAANRYFVDSTRIAVSLSNEDELAGTGESYLLDALVAEAGMGGQSSAADPAHEAAAGQSLALQPAQANSMPVSIVAQQSLSSPLVDVSIIVHAGAGMDPDNKKGLASMTAAMITDGGSSSHTIQEINAAMYPIASGFHAQVDKEMTRLSGQVHKDNLDKWYELVRGQLLAPAWSEQDFSRLRKQLVNAIRSGLVSNNDEELAKEMLYAEIYRPGHPYGSLNLGAVNDLEALTLDDLRQFYADYYTINNITVGLSGGYPDSFAARLSDDLQSRPAGQRVVLNNPDVPAPDGSRALIIEKDTAAVAVSLGFPIDLKRGDADWIALWLVRSYLGEHRNTSSHLFKRIREERGLNYGDYTYIEYFPRGMFAFKPGTNLARQQQIFQVWLRPLRNNNDAHFATRAAIYELDKLVTEGLSESDFEATRSFLGKYVSLLTDGQSRQLGYALDSEYYEIENFVNYVRDGLNDLTLADVNRVIRENLSTDNMQYVFVAKDAQDLRDRLTGNRMSPLTYDAGKSESLLLEDTEIETLSLGLREDTVRVTGSEDVFN